MNRIGIARWLRIGWTALCATVAVLLCVLWVRSYWCVDEFTREEGYDFVAIGWNGGAITYRRLHADVSSGETGPWEYSRRHPTKQRVRFRWDKSGGNVVLDVPVLPIAVILACCSFAPWIKWRYSLRSLLLTVSLVAVLLGCVVWAMR